MQRVGALVRKTTVDLERARDRLPWLDDDDLDDLEPRSAFGAAVLGVFTWGGGRLYVGDHLRGAVGILALIAWIALSSVMPDVVGSLVWIFGGTAGALWAHRGARDVNRYVRTRTELALTQGPSPAAYRLLAAHAAVTPSLEASVPAVPTAPAPSARHQPLVDELRKLEALRVAGLLATPEVRDRKIDLFTAAAPASRAELDDLLYALMPLRGEGAIDDDDVAFVKQLGGEL